MHEDLENLNYINCYFKLELWNLQRYTGQAWNRAVYIDADAIVVGNLEEVFYSPDMEPPTNGVIMAPDYDWRAGLSTDHSHRTCKDTSHKAPTSASSTVVPVSSVRDLSTEPRSPTSHPFDHNSGAYKLPSKDSYSKAHCAAAFKEDSYCNAGVIILRPSQVQHHRLLQTLKTFKHSGLAEQDLFHEVFTRRGLTKVCEQGYNAQKWIFICAPEIWATFNLKIIHYNNEKPWALEDGKTVPSIKKENVHCAELVRLWHSTYEAAYAIA